ncbi:MAG: sialidase family protein [Opitutales bacterium]
MTRPGCLTLLAFALAAAPLAPAAETFPLTAMVIASPAAPGSIAPALSTGNGAAVTLSWVEPAARGGRLRCANFDRTSRTWSDPHTIVTSAQLKVGTADTPLLATGPHGELAAVWIETVAGGGREAQVSRSTDAGATWTSPARVTTESKRVSCPNLAWLPDGRLLAAWLDDRTPTARGVSQLYARVVGADGPDLLVDISACAGCPTALTVFPDGSALLAFRGRSTGNVCDIHTSTWSQDRWTAPRILSGEGWQISDELTEGPRLASAGGMVAAAWFSAAHRDPQVLGSTSPDAGDRFTSPLSLGDVLPVGRPDTCMLRDGSVLTLWLEDGQTPGLYLRRTAPSLELNPPVRLAITRGDRENGYPRIALVKDYDRNPAEVMVAYLASGAPAGIRTQLVTLPDLSALAGRNPCIPCDENDANATRGYPVKGRIAELRPDQAVVLLQHEEIPGVMRAATLACKVDPKTLPQLAAGGELLGRIEQRDRAWWLFNIMLLGAPVAPAPSRAP